MDFSNNAAMRAMDGGDRYNDKGPSYYPYIFRRCLPTSRWPEKSQKRHLKALTHTLMWDCIIAFFRNCYFFII